jgi:hypothetical protein
MKRWHGARCCDWKKSHTHKKKDLVTNSFPEPRRQFRQDQQKRGRDIYVKSIKLRSSCTQVQMYSGPDVRVLRPVCRQGLIYSGLSGLNVLKPAYTLPGLNVGIQDWLYQGCSVLYSALAELLYWDRAVLGSGRTLGRCTEAVFWADVLRP